MSSNSEEKMRGLLKTIYKPAFASPEFRGEMLKRLSDEISGKAKDVTIPLWQQPRLWVAVAAVLILAAIAYGILILPAEIANTSPLTPPPVSVP
jgi:anti-sigma-K factor RskA